MNGFFKAALVIVAINITFCYAQFPSDAQHAETGGPVAVGQQMLHKSDDGKVSLVPAVAPSGGVIQLSAFGWLEPYVDSAVQALLMAGLAWLGKSKYTQWMDQAGRDAMEAFAKNTANSLIADGFVQMRGKAVHVDNVALAAEANSAATRIPDALKRFGITPDVVAAKIVDAIPQTPAGAAIVATAHSTTVSIGDVSVSGNIDNIKAAGPGADPYVPPTAALPA